MYKVHDLVFSCMRSRISYESPEKIKKIYKDRINSVIQHKIDPILNTIIDTPIFYDGNNNKNKQRDSQGYAIWKENTVYFSFRGTSEMKDITDVIDIRGKNLGNNIIVHTGFYEQFMAIENEITLDCINLFESYPIERIIFAGHSMGGSIATIASLFYARKFNNKHVTCHTFGSPKTGNIGFVEAFKQHVEESKRVEVEEDIVPSLPMTVLFKHVPDRILLKAKDKNLFNKIKKAADNHSCENYIERLEANVSSNTH